MKFALVATAICFAMTAGAATAMPRIDTGSSSSVVLIQKKEKEEKATHAPNGGNGRKDATKQDRDTRSNKGGETRGQDRAGQGKDMNQSKKAQ